MATVSDKALRLPSTLQSSEDGDDIGGEIAAAPGTIVNEKALIRKIDLRLLPVLCILYLLAFLDRVNISNAVIFGLQQDLKLNGVKFNTALTIFFVPYVFLDIPSNWLLKKLRPHVWRASVSICMFMFGLVTVMQGLVHNYSGLLTTRFFLGVFESGMFPGCFYLITMWYKRSESQKRCSFFFNSATLAGAFGGLLASAIGKMDGLRGFRGWRWIFILEGLLTCILAICFYFLIVDFPEEATFLTEQERLFIRARLHGDVGDSARGKKLTVKETLKVFKDYKIFLGALMYFGLIVPAYGYAYFAPTIVQSYGYGPIETQLRSVPPWVVTFVLSMALATISDHIRRRYVFTILPLFLSLAGAIILRNVHHDRDLQYGALFLVAAGTYSAMPVVICWFNTNVAGHHRRAVATAFQIGFGNIGGIISTYSFLNKDKPYYVRGYDIVIGFTVLSIVACTAYWAACVVENRRREKGLAGENDVGDGRVLGDLWAGYRYMT